MIKKALWKLVGNPWIYRLTQVLIAPGFEAIIKRQFEHWLRQLPCAGRILDVACGPSSHLWLLGLKPIGLDLSKAYTEKFKNQGGTVVNASADAMPFLKGSFDAVWSMGLLHHVPAETAKECISEMMRVLSESGYIMILDSVLPEPAWRNPVASIVRSLDKGRFVRRQRDLEALLPDREMWFCQRVVYSLNGLEALYCIYQKGRGKRFEPIPKLFASSLNQS